MNMWCLNFLKWVRYKFLTKISNKSEHIFKWVIHWFRSNKYLPYNTCAIWQFFPISRCNRFFPHIKWSFWIFEQSLGVFFCALVQYWWGFQPKHYCSEITIKRNILRLYLNFIRLPRNILSTLVKTYLFAITLHILNFLWYNNSCFNYEKIFWRLTTLWFLELFCNQYFFVFNWKTCFYTSVLTFCCYNSLTK